MSDKSNAVVIGVIAGIAALMFVKKSVPGGSSNLIGIVTDSATGAVIPGVSVMLDNLTAISDSAGSFTFSGIAPGGYTLTATKNTYKDFTTPIVINPGEDLNFDFLWWKFSLVIFLHHIWYLAMLFFFFG